MQQDGDGDGHSDPTTPDHDNSDVEARAGGDSDHHSDIDNASNSDIPIHLPPPPPIVVPPKSKTLHTLRLSQNDVAASASQIQTFCAREVQVIYVSQGSVILKRYVIPPAAEFDEDYVYIVVGMLGNDECLPKEVKRLVRKSKSEDLFKQIRRATQELRPLHRRLLSLKRVSGFAIYQCCPKDGYHRVPVMDSRTKRTIQELYRDYRALDRDYGNRWLDWIHHNFNNGSPDPSKGAYSLRLVLSWSPAKIAFWGIAPIILSLVIGLWYMLKPTPNEDFLTIVQTAWAIASYIVTAAALGLAVMATITQIGDI